MDKIASELRKIAKDLVAYDVEDVARKLCDLLEDEMNIDKLMQLDKYDRLKAINKIQDLIDLLEDLD